MRSLLVLMLLGPLVGVAVFLEKGSPTQNVSRADRAAMNEQKAALQTLIIAARDSQIVSEIEELRSSNPARYREALAKAILVDDSITIEMSVSEILDRMKKNPVKGVEAFRYLFWATDATQSAARWSAE